MTAPTPAFRGRFVVAAVAAGAVTVAAGHSAASTGVPGAEKHRTIPSARDGADARVALAVGGAAPAPGVLPIAATLDRPQVVQVAPRPSVAELEALTRVDRRNTERAAAEQAAAAAAAAAALAAAEQLDAPEDGSGGPGDAERTDLLSPGSVVAPVEGTITSNFGPRWGSTHYGLDVANEIGTPIYSATDGEVINSGPANGFGLWVQVRADDGTVTTYGHIDETLVEVGQQVTAGEQIATVGNRGQSTGPHLHFEVQIDGEKVDPLEWLRSNGVDM